MQLRKLQVQDKVHISQERYKEKLTTCLENKSVFKVKDGKFDSKTNKIKFELNGKKIELSFDDQDINGLKLFQKYFKDSSYITECGDFNFEFYIFDLKISSENPSKYMLDKDEKDIIKEHRIYLYRDNIRVMPYGDPDDDWLRIDMARGTVSAAEFLSNDQVVGCVYITQDGNPKLKDKTNREGLIEEGKALEDFINVLQLILKYLRKKVYAQYLIDKKRKADIDHAKKGRPLSQDELAEKVMVTRQAVSRWENGETVPNTETLKLLSKEFDVSINTLLGEPRKLICQCCGMPLEDDSIIGRDSDGSLNEDYCKWCYADGTYTYSDMDELINVCVRNMVDENFPEEQARSYMKELLPKLDYWKRYEELSDNGQFEAFKKQLIQEINDLHIEGMPKVEKLNALVGKYVNLEYPLPNGKTVKFLDDQATYLGNQLECEFGGDRCFGVLASMDFIIICTYDAKGTSPELILYKKR